MDAIKNNYIIQAWLVLILCLLFGISLAGVQLTLSPKILENKRNETLKKVPSLVLSNTGSVTDDKKKEKIEIVSFTATSEGFRKKKNYQVYEVKNGKGDILGYVSKSSGQGYADKIQILVGFDPFFEALTGLFVLDQKETPGLGNKITERFWRKQFPGKKTSEKFLVVKNGAGNKNEIDAVTGATISSRSVLTILNQMVTDLKGPLQKRMSDHLNKPNQDDENGK